MEVVEAVWEKRNLDRVVYEVTLNNSDLRDIDRVIARLGASPFDVSYTVLKLPVANVAAVHSLESAGFRFLETQINVSMDCRDYELPNKLRGIAGDGRQVEVPKNPAAWQALVDKIGVDMFHTDRVAQDPLFSVELSRRRYCNWIMDLCGNLDYRLYLYCLDREGASVDFAFTLDRVNARTKTIHSVLGGVFPDANIPFAGFMMNHLLFKNAREHGFSVVKTSISSNNLPIVGLDSAFGYSIDKMMYVMRR